MKPIHIATTSAETLEALYTRMADPNQEWPRYAVLLAIAVARGGSHRQVAIAAKAMRTLPFDVQERLLSDYAIPSEVRAAYDNADAEAWPDARAIAGFDDPENVDIARVKLDAVARVNWKSDRKRREFVTPIIGQSTVYRIKASEAKDYLAQSPTPADPSPWPHIAKEAVSTRRTPLEVATTYANENDRFIEASSDLDAARVGTIDRIKAATTVEEVRALEAAFAP